MYYGIEATTDLHNREVVIKKFVSLSSAFRWRGNFKSGFAFSGAADSSLSLGRQNFHSRHRVVYEMPKGWRFPCKLEIIRGVELNRCGGYTYGKSDYLRDLICRDGTKVEG